MAKTYTGTFAFSPNLPLTVSYDKANAAPADIALDLTMDFFPDSGAGEPYDRFFLRILVADPIIGGVYTRVIDLSGEIPDAPDQTIEVFEGFGTSTGLLIDFSGLSSVPNGSHTTQISFILSGQVGSEFAYILDSVTDTITVNVSGAGSEDPPVVTIGIDPESLVFTHALDKALPTSKNIEVTSGGPFKVSVFGPFNLSGPSLTLVQNINGVKEYAGTTDQTVTVALAPEVVNEAPNIHEYLAVFVQTGAKSALIGSLGITLYLFENSNLVISPTALEFFAIKNIQEALPQTITVAGPEAFTVTRPSWLNVSPTSGQGYAELVVVPNATSVLDEGPYEGNIILTTLTDTYIVPVIHNVYGNVQLGVSPNKINFTDDYSTITRFYEQVNFKLLLNFEISFYNYGVTLLNETALAYVLGFFNNRTKFFIGQTLNSIMKELLQLQAVKLDNLENVITDNLMPIRNYYLPAAVKMTALFKNDFNEEADKTKIFENIKFIKGRKPKTEFDDTFILDYYRDPLRVTVNSIVMFNFYKEKNHVFRIYKNGVFQNSISHSIGTQRIFGYKLNFQRYAPGDVVELRLYKNIDGAIDETWFDTKANYIAQQYIVLPEGKASNHIGYEDEYGLLKIIEFTGAITFENGYENTVAKNYEEFLETSKKLDSKKSRKCTANTGFIFKSNTKNIDALLISKRAWILSETNKKSISMIPTNKSMSDVDSDQDLYAYDVEFEINFNNDFEINT